MTRQVFFLILFLGVILRVFTLTGHDFWLDEALTYHFAKLDLKNLLTIVASDNNPPLYYVLIHFLLKISSNEIFLRLPSFLTGILTVFALWRLSPVAAAFFSVSPLAIYLSSEARLHSMTTLLAVLTYLSFLKVLKKSNFINIALFLIVSTLALYTQYYLALLLIPLLLITIFRKKKLVWVNFVPLLLLAPWLIFSLPLPHNGCWCPNTIISLPATLVSPIIGGVGIVTQRNFINLPLTALILFTITSIIFLTIFAKGIFKDLSLSAVYFTPLIILSFLGIFWPVFSPKGASVFSPFFFLISSQSLLKNHRGLFISLIILLTAISLVQITSPFFKGEDLKAVSRVIKNKNQPVIHTSLATFYSEDYYSPTSQHFLITSNPLNQKMVDLIGGKQTDIGNFEEIWLIDYPKWVDPDLYQKRKNLILTNYHILKKYSVDNIEVLDLTQK